MGPFCASGPNLTGFQQRPGHLQFLKTHSVHTLFFERGCPFSPLRKLFTPFLFIADSYVESAGECSPSPVHAERGYTNKPFSLHIFKLYRRKVLNRFPECCKTRFDRKLYCEKKHGKVKDVLFQRNPLFSPEASTVDCPLVPRNEGCPGKPRPACWCKQSSGGPGCCPCAGL